MWVEFIGHCTSRDRNARLRATDSERDTYQVLLPTSRLTALSQRFFYPSRAIFGHCFDFLQSCTALVSRTEWKSSEPEAHIYMPKREPSLPGEERVAATNGEKEQSRPSPTRQRLNVNGMKPVARRRNRHRCTHTAQAFSVLTESTTLATATQGRVNQPLPFSICLKIKNVCLVSKCELEVDLQQYTNSTTASAATTMCGRQRCDLITTHAKSTPSLSYCLPRCRYSWNFLTKPGM